VAAASKRGWRIARAAIMADHVHAVVLDCPIDGPAVRRVLKGNAYAVLRDHWGKSKHCWTTGGSDRQKRGEEAILTAIQYVADQEYKLAEIIDMQAVRCAAK
jgi:REP element-mobilizing transposase RayT